MITRIKSVINYLASCTYHLLYSNHSLVNIYNTSLSLFISLYHSLPLSIFLSFCSSLSFFFFQSDFLDFFVPRGLRHRSHLSTFFGFLNNFATLQNEVAKVDPKRTPSYSSDLHFLGLRYRPNRGTLICSKKLLSNKL